MPSLKTLRSEAADCRACPLWKRGTQTVFGEGPAHARLMFVGEQPGDREDVAGHPFVGPAGQLFNRLLEEAGIDRKDVYVTNVVKHFKWKERGKKRIHDKPSGGEVKACFPWLEAEIAAVEPEIVVALGATAAQALLGPGFRVTRERGKFVTSPHADVVLATVHPSSILREPDREARHAAERAFVRDLAKVSRRLTTRKAA